MEVGILGAGYSGVCLAIFLARNNIKVNLIEHTDTALKKILSTGNGRCNYTNKIQTLEKYHNNKFAFEIISDFNFEDTIIFFESLGIKAIFRDGYAYPYSEQAKSIREALLLELNRLNVKVIYNTKINKLKISESIYLNLLNENRNSFDLKVDKFIFATGTKAFEKSGSDGSSLKILDFLDIKYNEFLPALSSLYAKEKNFFKLSAGVRAMARINLLIAEEEVYSEYGQVQFTEYGLSGIPIFNCSALANKALILNKSVKVRINFLENIEDKIDFLSKRIKLGIFKEVKDLPNGIINDKLFFALLKRAGIRANKNIDLLSDKDVEVLNSLLFNSEFNIYYQENFDKAQVCTGGIDIRDLDENLAHKKYNNIYFAGEIIDVDAICGGYNLQWAISSAKRIAKILEKEKDNA